MNELLAELLHQWQQGRITGGELLDRWRRDGQPDVLLVQMLLALLENPPPHGPSA